MVKNKKNPESFIFPGFKKSLEILYSSMDLHFFFFTIGVFEPDDDLFLQFAGIPEYLLLWWSLR